MTRGQEGGVAVLGLAITAVGLLALGAVLALAAGYVAKAQAQDIADSAALAAARELPGAADAERRARASVSASGARLVDVRIPASGTTVEVAITVGGPLGLRVPARARAGGVGATGPVELARGGGYAGPLVRRDGKPICPAVAAAFDRMDAAAAGDGLDLVIYSGFRSDAEQAELFRRHPDPRWVAPPGRSRHRDATELDIDVRSRAGTHRWLADNAGRFGFVQRYSWEPWHWGYVPGCGAAATSVRDGALPAWVPRRYRRLVAASARAEGLPPAVLGALLMAESGFDPMAVSPAGARGIAQFMPATAAAVGLDDPFRPQEAIPAAAALLADHRRRFGRMELALAAYNAGPGAVSRHGGVPPYRETRNYVARIMALAGGSSPVRLIRAGRALV